MSSVAIRLFRRSHCSWRKSSFEPALPCEQALCPAGIWNHMTDNTCNLQPVWVTNFHGKVCHSRLPSLEWNAVFLIRHSTHQQRAWCGWQISPFRLPGDFCPHLFFVSRPNTIIKRPYSRISLADKNPPVKIVIFMVTALHGRVVV